MMMFDSAKLSKSATPDIKKSKLINFIYSKEKAFLNKYFNKLRLE